MEISEIWSLIEGPRGLLYRWLATSKRRRSSISSPSDSVVLNLVSAFHPLAIIEDDNISKDSLNGMAFKGFGFKAFYLAPQKWMQILCLASSDADRQCHLVGQIKSLHPKSLLSGMFEEFSVFQAVLWLSHHNQTFMIWLVVWNMLLFFRVYIYI